MLREMVIDGLEVPDEGATTDHAAELLQRVAQGDQAAFGQLYDMLSSRVFGLIMRVLVDRSQSEEVLQEVFLDVWQSAAIFDSSRGQARSWVLTIAHRKAVDRVRASSSSTDRDIRAGMRDYSSPAETVSDQVELKMEGIEVTEALATLSEVQREVLVLAYFGGYSQSEIGALTSTPLGTVKTRMRDGLTKLRSEMEVGR